MAEFVKRGDNKWLVRVFRGRDASGKRMFLNKTIHGPKKEAVKWAQVQELSLSAGTFCEPTKLTVSEYLTQWLDGMVGTRPRTQASYRWLINAYVIPSLGQYRLQDLRVTDLNTLYVGLSNGTATTVRKTTGPLGARSVRYTHSVLRKAFNDADKAGLLTVNPTKYAKLPRHERREMHAWCAGDAAQFLAAAKDDEWYPLWRVLLFGGLRPSEALGLKWADLEGNVIRVRRGLVYNSRADWTLTEPKTAKSRRAVPLDADTIAALKGHRQQQLKAKVQLGPHYTEHGFIFAAPDGSPVDFKAATRRRFTKLITAAEVPKIRPYDLRHSCASLLLAGGVHPKVVSERLGHSTITLTMDTYSHVLPTMQEDATQVLGNLLALRIKAS